MRWWKKKEKTRGQRWGQKNLFLLFSLEIVSITILILLLIFGEGNTLSVPMVVIFGVVAFLGVLTLAAAVLDFFELSNKDEALGLPSGSVRALIALSLILIFAIMVIFIATNLGVQEKTFPPNSNVIYGDKNITNSGTGNITIIFEPSQAAIDFSKQVLTTISTLVVALAGFYFGTKSVAQAQRSTTPPEASLSFDPLSPATLQLTEGGDNNLPITVTTTPENEVIEFRIKDEKPEGQSGTISRSVKPNVFVYTPPPGLEEEITVTIRFWMIRYPGDVEEMTVRVIPIKV